MNKKVSVVIPVYKPEKRVFDKLKKILNEQTIPVEIIEKWNNPEAVSMNLGIKEAKTDIVIILAQDCIPSDKYFIEKLIKPLEDPEVVASVSDLLLPYEEWKKRPYLIRIFTINDMKLRKPSMNLSSCAYRKIDLERLGYINENVSAIDLDFNTKIRKIGKVVRGNTVVYHLHPHYDYKKVLKTFYNYFKYNGIAVRTNGINEHAFLQKVVRAIPFLGLASVYYRYPLREYWYFLPMHFLFGGILDNVISVTGFWSGFFLGDEEGGSRNKEVLNNKNNLS